VTTIEERRDRRFHEATIAVLNDIQERGLQQPPELWYPTAFSTEQLAEIRIVLDQLSAVVREDTHLSDATKRKLDQLAQALRESEAQA
jgi:hypothetical protein